jgi:hypothetical protein
MYRMYRLTAAALFLATAASATNAYEFRVRFVERVGSAADGTDIELPQGNRLAVFLGGERRVRIQFGVFDDAEGPAPAGGYVGWNVGTITVNGGFGNSQEFRNSADGVHNGVGRLAPFNFAPSSGGANGLPANDPFESLTGIDNTLGVQGRVWNFGEPMPQPIIRGRNTWVSTFEISVDPSVAFSGYTIDFGGNLVAALGWRSVGEPLKPTEEEPGLVNYAPFVDDPRAFSATLHVMYEPAPGAAAVFVFGALVLNRRRR